MAKAPKQAVMTLIAGARRQNLDDKVIMKQLLSRNDIIGQNMRTTVDRVGLQEAASMFGLKVGAPTIVDKAKSAWGSVGMAGVNSFGGLVQGVAYLGDKANKGINSVLGTNLETNASGAVKKNVQELRNEHAAERAMAGKKSTDSDAIQTASEIAMVLPAATSLGPTLAARVANNAAIGAGVGAARYADSAKERVGNMAGGAAGGGIGQWGGEKIIAPVVGKAVTKVARRTANKSGNTARAAEKMVDDALRETKITVTATERTALVKNTTKALSKGKQKDVAAMTRKMVLDRHSIKGTQAQITRNPNTWANERELAKHNAPLNQVHIDNHQQLDDLMKGLVNDTGANPVNTQAKMQSTIDTLKQVNDAAKQKIGSLYESAQSMNGNNARLNHMRFINNATNELEQQQLGSFVKGDTMQAIKGMFERPDYEFSYGKAEELIKVINARMRTTTDGNQRAALGIIRKNLEKEIGQTADELANALPNGDGLGTTKQAFDEARGAYREHAQNVENTPFLSAAIDDVAPDNAFNKFVLNGNTRDLGNLVQTLKTAPNGQQNIKDLQGATIEHFLGKATQANTGAFSPSQLNRAIDSFGEDKLKMIFTPEQISRLNDIRQVSDILVQQPLGAHVNHSNTANAVIKQLLGLTGMVARVPMLGTVGNMVVGGAKAAADLSAGGKAARMINGTAPTTAKNSLLGLTPQQLKRLGLTKEAVTKLAAASGIAAGTNLARD